MRVVCFGELMLRLSAPGYQRLFQTGSLDALFCGSEANVAVSLANYGADVRYVTSLPEGAVGDAAIRSLRTYGVDMSCVVRGTGRMGIYFLERGASQRPSRVIYDRAGSAVALANPNSYRWEAILEGADWFHVSGITPALSDSCAEAVVCAVRKCHARGITVSCDLNYRSKLWSSEKAQSVMASIMPYVDVCMANEEDAQKMLGISAGTSKVEEGVLDVEGYHTLARQIAETYGCSHVAVTLRESLSASRNGWSALLYEAGSDELLHSKHYEIDVVDRVGAGDSFSAGIIYGLRLGWSARDTLEFATAASCLKHSIEGDLNLVSVEEVKALVAGDSSGRVRR